MVVRFLLFLLVLTGCKQSEKQKEPAKVSSKTPLVVKKKVLTCEKLQGDLLSISVVGGGPEIVDKTKLVLDVAQKAVSGAYARVDNGKIVSHEANHQATDMQLAKLNGIFAELCGIPTEIKHPLESSQHTHIHIRTNKEEYVLATNAGGFELGDHYHRIPRKEYGKLVVLWSAIVRPAYQ